MASGNVEGEPDSGLDPPHDAAKVDRHREAVPGPVRSTVKVVVAGVETLPVVSFARTETM